MFQVKKIFISLLSAAGFAFLSGCPGSKGSAEDEFVNVAEYVSSEIQEDDGTTKKAVTGTKLVSSDNGQFLYYLYNNTNLCVVPNTVSVGEIFNKNKSNEIKKRGLDENTSDNGKAQIDANTVDKLMATFDGLIASVGGTNYGILYVKGEGFDPKNNNTKATSAWNFNNVSSVGFVAHEFPYVYSAGKFLTIDQVLPANAGLTNELTRAGEEFSAKALMISGDADNAYIADSHGISFVVANGETAQIAAVPKDKFASDKWKFEATTDNTVVSAFAYHDGYLFVGLESTGPNSNTGGVFVMKADDGTAAATRSFKNESIISFIKHDNAVYAVTKDEVTHIKTDGSLGFNFIAGKQSGPDITGEIVSAAFFKDHLIVSTDIGTFAVEKKLNKVKKDK